MKRLKGFCVLRTILIFCIVLSGCSKANNDSGNTKSNLNSVSTDNSNLELKKDNTITKILENDNKKNSENKSVEENKYISSLFGTGSSETIMDEHNHLHTIKYAKRVLTKTNDTLFVLPLDSKENIVFQDERFEIYNCECTLLEHKYGKKPYYDIKGNISIHSNKAYDSIVLLFIVTDKNDGIIDRNYVGAVNVRNTNKSLLIPGESYEFEVNVDVGDYTKYSVEGFALAGITAYGGIEATQEIIDAQKANQDNDKHNSDDNTVNTGLETNDTIAEDPNEKDPLRFAKRAYAKVKDWNEDYIIPSSSLRYIDESELAGYSSFECKLIRNEIYAKHARKFNDAALKAYFESKWWYSRYYPYIDSSDFDENVLNKWEKANIQLVKDYEEKGCPLSSESNKIIRTVRFYSCPDESSEYELYLEYTSSTEGVLTFVYGFFDFDENKGTMISKKYHFVENESLEGIAIDNSDVSYSITYDSDYTGGAHIVIHFNDCGVKYILDEKTWHDDNWLP